MVNKVIDNNFKEFIVNHKDYILSTTPKSPSISSDDEWINETEWDGLFAELTQKEKK